MLRFSKTIMGTRNSDHYATPKAFYTKLDAEFHFDLDPCPLHATRDGLTIPWKGNIYVNPPYSNIQAFLEKGLEELRKGNAKIIVYLLPVRSDTKYWHEIILKHADEIRFVKGRLNFNEKKSPAPFSTCVVIFSKINVCMHPIISSTVQ